MPSPALLDPTKERTLLLVKPDGYLRGQTGEVLSRIERKGYVLRGLKVKMADPQLLAEHYAEHVDQHYYEGLEKYMMTGPVVAVVVEGDDVIQGLRAMAGSTNPSLAAPGTIRGDLGRDWGDGTVQNVVHTSDSPASAAREIALWFPELEPEEEPEDEDAEETVAAEDVEEA